MRNRFGSLHDTERRVIDVYFEFDCLVGQKYTLDCDFTDHHHLVSLLLPLFTFFEKERDYWSETFVFL